MDERDTTRFYLFSKTEITRDVGLDSMKGQGIFPDGVFGIQHHFPGHR